MKKVRISLSVFAIALALGATFAFAPINPVFEYIDNPSNEPDQCIQKSLTCQVDESLVRCRMTTDSPILREHGNATTQCGRQLWKTP